MRPKYLLEDIATYKADRRVVNKHQDTPADSSSDIRRFVTADTAL